MKNELNKFSLISLVENLNEVELNEIQPAAAEDALATFRNIGKGSKAAQQVAQDIVATMSRGGEAGEAIHIIGKGNNLIPAKNGGELLNALNAFTALFFTIFAAFVAVFFTAFAVLVATFLTFVAAFLNTLLVMGVNEPFEAAFPLKPFVLIRFELILLDEMIVY